eukprot:6514959-Lingulodinium_polyedra.AAC.1
MAAVAATVAMPQDFLLVTDSRYVRDGIHRLRDGEDPSEWRHADMWALIRARAVGRTLDAMWVPSHRTAEDYAARGIPERHRLGNAAADAAASGVAALRAPPAAWRTHRAAQLADAEACQR